MAVSKTNVAARADDKERSANAVCKFCKQKPDVAMVMRGGKMRMFRRCCEKAGIL